ncbi:16S rRNA (cytosine(967)-C(5))-methyltransferase RsmB [Peptacetobacter sp.]|uniref:16S rRNA (cytosine(967)-C(5))-methyltransferase RsmB n=1 Tax=Peptacetobacter sp. TaxID=2991975 RepID=UPI0026024412|nr:16S rRNA (cytosine(967)-C(5))-methyltransferase RsmB [Peptacetobacter sp.]
MNAREAAFKILCDIEIDKNYSNMAINKIFKNNEINDKDKGLATEIVYGVIENKKYLDFIINKLSKIKVKKMSSYVKIILRMGTYQILFLDNIENYAAVNETVKLANKYDKKSRGFVNAILRNEIRQERTIKYIDIEDPIRRLAVKYSYQQWIIEDWVDKFGMEFTEELLEAGNERPNLYLRTNTLKIDRETLLKEFEKEGIKANKAMLPEGIMVEKFKGIENSRLYKEGYFTIQDISSMLVAKVMNPKENDMVLDVCSAPGGKSTHMAELMKNTGKVVSRDVFEHKIKVIKAASKRLGINNIEAEEFDATKLDKESIEKFDCVLADVPCSGFGIIKRKPEIKYKSKEELKDLPEIQAKILENASKYVKIGGTLVYSTCTVQDCENIDIVNEFLEKNSNYKLVPIEGVNVDPDEQERGYLKIYPHIHGIDGFFIAKMKRVK